MTNNELYNANKIIIRITEIFIFALLCYQISTSEILKDFLLIFNAFHPVLSHFFMLIIYITLGFLVSPVFIKLINSFHNKVEKRTRKINTIDLLLGIFGVVIGLHLANFIIISITKILGRIASFASIFIYVTFAFLSLHFFLKRKLDFYIFFSQIIQKKDESIEDHHKSPKEFRFSIKNALTFLRHNSCPKILDTSAIIDGRILDVAQTGFLEGSIVLPRFILTELQRIADSTDPLRRTKGRRGMTVVAELQKLKAIKIDISETKLQDLEREYVDEALVALAKKINAKIITTDYNLNQIAQIEGVSVLNVNDLTNSLKPILLPGENVEVEIIRAGKEHQQGIGYLDDGTMLVVEDGYKHIGERVKITVTSILQTSAGRMVFGRIQA